MGLLRRRAKKVRARYLTFATAREGSGAGDSARLEPVELLNRWLEDHHDLQIISIQEIEKTYASGGYRARYFVVYA